MTSKVFPVNEHPVERVLRVLAGGTLLALAATGTVGGWGWLGVLPIATGLLGSCPTYTLLGVSTCRASGRNAGVQGGAPDSIGRSSREDHSQSDPS